MGERSLKIIPGVNVWREGWLPPERLGPEIFLTWMNRAHLTDLLKSIVRNKYLFLFSATLSKQGNCSINIGSVLKTFFLRIYIPIACY